MEHISKTIARQQESSGQSTKPEQRKQVESSITNDHIRLFWKRMTMIYGHKWASSYGELDDGTWAAGLADLELEDIRRGIEAVRDSGKEWPPSLPEFRDMCKKPATPFDGVYKRLPKPQVDPELVEEYIREMREKIQ